MADHAAQFEGGFVIVDRAADHDFEARLAESSTLAIRVAYAVLRRREDAEDVAQEAFVRAFRHFARLRDRDRFRAWLVRTTWRLALDRRRGERRRLARDGEWDAGFPSSQAVAGEQADELVARERAARLWEAIDALPEKLRVTLVLASIEGHEVADVARLLAVPAGTVKSRLFLARKRLKEHLQWMQTDQAGR
jgi:RNA polymerase sigma-70 factor (ECF subfamily)